MKRLSLRVSLLAGLLLIGACAPVDALNFVTYGGDYALVQDVAYGKAPHETLDIYRPPGEAKKPVVMFIYGGSWRMGDKSDYKFLGQSLAEAGYIVMVPNYRLSPDKFPSFIQDTAKAITWAERNAARYGGDPKRVYAMGHSAGAYNVMMALTYPGVEEKYRPKKLAGVVGLSGPYDFLPLTDPKLIDIFGGKDNYDTQPITHARAGLPPMLLMTGAEDDIVSPDNTKHYAAALRAKGNKVKEIYVPDVSHLGMIGGFSDLLRNGKVKNPVLEFLAR